MSAERWRAHADAIARTYDLAKTLPSEALWQPLYALKREADAAVQELARLETAYEQTARGLAAYATVAAYLQATRTGLSATAERGLCLLEQDGTVLHCAPTIGALAAWVQQQDAPTTTQAPTGGLRDYTAREWIT
jgi:hypothetical protein